MNASSKERFDCLCRTCMHEVEGMAATVASSMASEQVEWQSIFDFVAECGALRIAELLTSTTPQITIEMSDELPKKICKECLQQLLNVYRFQQMCIRSDQQMRGFLEYGIGEMKCAQMVEAPTAMSVTLDSTEISEGDPLQSTVNGFGESDSLVVLPVEVISCMKMELNEKEDNVSERSTEGILDVYGHLKTENAEASEVNDAESQSDNNDDSDWNQEDHNDTCSRKPRRSKKRSSIDKQMNVTSIEEEKKREETSLIVKAESTIKHDLDAFACSECGKVFSKLMYLRKHINRHAAAAVKGEVKSSNKLNHADSYKCDECSRRFIKPESLYKHRQTHNPTTGVETPAERHKCDVCAKEYSTRRILAKHKRIHDTNRQKASPDAPKPYVCKYCNKAFQQSCTLKDHVRTHTGEQPYLCSECGKAFNSSSNMKQHLLRHTGVKRYECPECPKKFPCLSDLASHKAVHIKIKPHICDVCGAAFGKPYQLKKHKMYHSGDKPHKCEYCDMRFVCADHMRRHMRTHTGEKPYKCKYCERAFAQSNDLIKHLRSHLGENVYMCELCPCAFRLAADLRNHFTVHKNDDPATRESNLKALMEEEVKLRLNIVDSTLNHDGGQQESEKSIASN